MKKIVCTSLFFVFFFSVSSSAQHYHYYKHKHKKSHYYHFHQSNGISYEFFNDYENDNQFGNYRLLPSNQSIRYNRVDALFLGIGSDFDNHGFGLFDIDGVSIDGYAGYSIGQEEWQYRAGVSKHIGRAFLFGAEILNTTTTDDFWRTSLTENTLTSLTAGYDYHDYYKAEGYGFYSELELGRFMALAASYNYTTYSSVLNNTDYALFGHGNIERINPAIDARTDKIYQESIGLKLTLNKNSLTRNRSFTSKLAASAELSDAKGMKNDFAYNKYEVTSLSYLKLDRSTLLKIRLMGGSITGQAPDFKSFALGGIGSLRASGYKFYRGNKMLMSNAELIFGDIFHFHGGHLDLDGLYLSVFMDSGWTDFVNNNSKDPFSGFNNFNFDRLTHNIGGGVGLSFLRLEIATPLEGSEGFTTFWIRLNPTF